MLLLEQRGHYEGGIMMRVTAQVKLGIQCTVVLQMNYKTYET